MSGMIGIQPWMMAAQQGTLLFARFAAMPLGALATLPSGLSYSRTTAGTVQTSASTLVTGIGVDVARIGMNGLVIEPSTIERILNNRDMTAGTWTAGSGTTTGGQSDPTGASGAFRQVVSAGGYGAYDIQVIAQDKRCLSFWVRGYNATSRAGLCTYTTGTVGAGTFDAAVSTTWRRMWTSYSAGASAITTVTTNHGGNLALIVGYPGAHAGPFDIVTDFISLQGQLFALEPVITAGSQVTTGGDRLWVPNASLVIHQGRLTQVIEYTAKCSIGGSNDSATAMRYGSGNATNYVSVHQTTGVVSVVVGGATYTTSAGFTQAIGDVIRIVVAMGSASLVSAVTIQKNGGAVTKYVDSAPQGAITGVTTWDIACNGTASELPSSIAEVSFLPHGRMPSWAA